MPKGVEVRVLSRAQKKTDNEVLPVMIRALALIAVARYLNGGSASWF
jgi:hypothetical protein